MPDHDTHDLDAAFARLEQDISSLSTPPGAGAAVARARRRRRTTVAAVAAATVLAVSGVAIGQGFTGHDASVSPADQLPAPAPLDGPHLTAATRGWTPAWTSNSRAAQRKIGATFGGACMGSPDGGRRNGFAFLGNTHQDVAFGVLSDYAVGPGREQKAWKRLTAQLEACPGAERISSFSDPSGAKGHTYRIAATPSESAPAYEWIVTTGQAIGVLTIFDQAEPLPGADDRPVADALLAAAQSPASYEQATQPSAGGIQRIDPTKTLGQVWAEALAPALAGWDNPWRPQLTKITGAELPSCAGDFAGDAAGSSQTLNVGRNGHEWIQWFDEEASAVAAVARLQDNLTSCSTPSSFHTVTLPDGRPVLVGVGPETVWVERVGSHVLLVHIPTGSTPPPDHVSLAVGAVLEEVLERPATTTVSPGDTPPSWMKPEIASAPTFGP